MLNPIGSAPLYESEIGIIDMGGFTTRYNRYGRASIDNYTKHAWASPVQSRTTEDLVERTTCSTKPMGNNTTGRRLACGFEVVAVGAASPESPHGYPGLSAHNPELQATALLGRAATNPASGDGKTQRVSTEARANRHLATLARVRLTRWTRAMGLNIGALGGRRGRRLI